MMMVKDSCEWDGVDSTVIALYWKYVAPSGEWKPKLITDANLLQVLTPPEFVPVSTNFVMQCSTADRMIVAKLVDVLSKDQQANLRPLMESLKNNVDFAELCTSGFAAVVVKTHWVLKVTGNFIADRNVFKITESDDEDIIPVNTLVHALEILDMRKWPELELIRLPKSRTNKTKRSLRV